MGLEFEAVCQFHLGNMSIEQENRQKPSPMGQEALVGIAYDSFLGKTNVQYIPKQHSHCTPLLPVGLDLQTFRLLLSALAQHEAGLSLQG